ncbi:MAG: hypothetical protein DRP01_02560 [Archaeoglobales archaeon]|nr:MAG: hypothetical protein DRP01_02560 [Archaeoglobales archaeon]
MSKGWKRINVPAPICDVIDRIKKKERSPRWKVVARAILTYAKYDQEIDRRIWYIFKIMQSYAYLKISLELKKNRMIDDNYVQYNFSRFKKTMKQIHSRFRVDTRRIVKDASEMVERFTGSNIGKVNEQIKELIKVLLIIESEEESKEVV